MKPEILQQMLQTVLNIIMFEDCRSVCLCHPLHKYHCHLDFHFHKVTFTFGCNLRNQWSMSRPLLGLILLNEDYFQVHVKDKQWITINVVHTCSTLMVWTNKNHRPFRPQNLRDQVIASQQADKRAAMMTWSDIIFPFSSDVFSKYVFFRFENLMEGIERTLLTKNRDRFTQNLSVFRRDINDSLKGPNVTTATSANDMMTS